MISPTREASVLAISQDPGGRATFILRMATVTASAQEVNLLCPAERRIMLNGLGIKLAYNGSRGLPLASGRTHAGSEVCVAVDGVQDVFIDFPLKPPQPLGPHQSLNITSGIVSMLLQWLPELCCKSPVRREGMSQRSTGSHVYVCACTFMCERVSVCVCR